MKKRLVFICGTMGVGKTTVSRSLQSNIENCVFLDGDWCFDFHPFTVTDETKQMILENISFLLRQFLNCSLCQTVLFCWVMHEQQIIDAILSALPVSDCNVFVFRLTCTQKDLRARLQKDIQAGKRTPDVIERSIARLPFYESVNAICIDTTDRTIEQITQEILNFWKI